MPVITQARMREIDEQILLAMHCPPDTAQLVADVLVTADIKGVDSHGSRLLAMYQRNVAAGHIIPTARPDIIRQDGAVTLLDGHWCFGHVGARLAAAHAIASAKAYGIGAATLVNCLHIGRVGDYSEKVAEAGMLGIVMCNANRATTPLGGMERMLGTNPIALAAPRQDGQMLSVDFATSAKSINKMQLYRQRGKPLPEDVILDKNGYPTTDPNDFFAGGILLPVGGYKGYALNLFIDIIGGVLIGAGPGAMIDKSIHPGNGTLVLALDISRWRSTGDFEERLDTLLGIVKGVPLAPGYDEILLPGELEVRAETERRRTGIPFDDETWNEIKGVAQKVGAPESLFEA